MTGLRYAEFRGKVCIVTGASSGIGKAIAIALAKYGCCLTVTGRNEPRLEETKEKCIEAGLKYEQVLVVKADLRVEQEIKEIFDKTISHYRRLDYVVNNAGVVHFDLADDSMEKYHEVLQVDLHSVVYLNQLAIPHLEKTQGVIINVSSCSGIRPIAGCLAYGMAKAALDHYTRIKSVELAAKGVRINNVNPGIVLTEVFANAGLPAAMVDAVFHKATTWNELNRAGEPDEVATVVCFLLSSNSDKTTGANFVVDGGFIHMHMNSGESLDVIETMKEQVNETKAE